MGSFAPSSTGVSRSWMYHPLSVVVRSARGESSLAARLARALSTFHQVGRVRHGAVVGGDPGAQDCWGVVEVDGRQSAFRREGHFDLPALRLLLLDADLVVVDGPVDDGSMVIVETDAQGAGMETLSPTSSFSLVACVGPRPPRVPPGGIACFRDDDFDGLVDHLRDQIDLRLQDRPLWGLLETEHGPDHSASVALAEFLRGCTTGLLVRGTQAASWGRFGAIALEAGHPSWGRLGALLSLWDFDPSGAYFRVDAASGADVDLQRLLRERDPLQCATAFREIQTHLPRVDAVIWEPKSRSKILQSVAAGLSCPQRTLVHARTKLLDRSV
ncbi:MAG: hypothetical protein IPK50_00145 [Fibrobacterota bacterium]|nr:MAG: hypothetical protein IPK50_00145 [Fibrobacterota bacterium]